MREQGTEMSPYKLENEYERLWSIYETLLASGQVQEAEAVLVEMHDLEAFMGEE